MRGVLSVTPPARRRLLARRHRLDGGAASPDAVVAAMLALHATDPASVFISVLARSRDSTLADVSEALYVRRSLVRWMAMRRTLFVFDRADVPMIQAAVSADVAEMMRRRLVSRIERNGCSPPVDGDVGEWLEAVQSQVEAGVARLGEATGGQLASEVPALGTVITPGAPSEQPVRVTTSLLTLMGAEGRIVRGSAVGAWTNRQHRWEPAATWWPDGLPSLDVDGARRELAARWLARFGPALAEDLRWWTGWNQTTTKRTLAGLGVIDVDLHGEPGIALDQDVEEMGEAAEDSPVAALLPALDPTPMGFKRREWFLGVDADLLFDRMGNIGPTLWWDGEIIGGWNVTPAGEVRTAILADRGAEAHAAVERAAEHLQARLEGTIVRWAFHTPLERALGSGADPEAL